MSVKLPATARTVVATQITAGLATYFWFGSTVFPGCDFCFVCIINGALLKASVAQQRSLSTLDDEFNGLGLA